MTFQIGQTNWDRERNSFGKLVYLKKKLVYLEKCGTKNGFTLNAGSKETLLKNFGFWARIPLFFRGIKCHEFKIF